MAIAPLRGLVPIAHVADVQHAVDFYAKLGFKVMGTLAPQGKLAWAWLYSGSAHLMVSRSSRPMNPDAQDVLFYLYAPDVAKYREQLAEQGVKVSALTYPEYGKAGEFRVTDVDGYCLLIGQADEGSK
ncbi:MAG TPA: VOC family protein [Terriglobales bacterium]|nr:VOC family protein [Terriglobales bacterium]